MNVHYWVYEPGVVGGKDREGSKEEKILVQVCAATPHRLFHPRKPSKNHKKCILEVPQNRKGKVFIYQLLSSIYQRFTEGVLIPPHF